MHNQYRNESAGVICIKELDINLLKKDLLWLGALKKGEIEDDEDLIVTNMWIEKIKIAKTRLEPLQDLPVRQDENPYDGLTLDIIERSMRMKFPEVKPSTFPPTLSVVNFDVRAAIREMDWLGKQCVGPRTDPRQLGIMRWKKMIKDALSRFDKEGDDSEGESV